MTGSMQHDMMCCNSLTGTHRLTTAASYAGRLAVTSSFTWGALRRPWQVIPVVQMHAKGGSGAPVAHQYCSIIHTTATGVCRLLHGHRLRL